jgi:hypothetical protein
MLLYARDAHAEDVNQCMTSGNFRFPCTLAARNSNFVFSAINARLKSLDHNRNSISGSIGSGGAINGSGDVNTEMGGMVSPC